MCIYIERYNYISLYAYVQSRDVFCVYILVLNCCCTGCVPLVKGKIEINQQHVKSKRAVHIRSRKRRLVPTLSPSRPLFCRFRLPSIASVSSSFKKPFNVHERTQV